MVGKGKFVVFEGLDGSGKSTVSALFAEALVFSRPVVLTAEPWPYGAAGDFIQQALRKELVCTPWTLALAFAVNRADHLRQIVIPALEAGKTVVCDRYLMSSLVYQITDDIFRSDIRKLNREAIAPTVTFFLNADIVTCAERIAKRSGKRRELFEDDLESRAVAYRGALIEWRTFGWRVEKVDAETSREGVLAQVMETWKHFE